MEKYAWEETNGSIRPSSVEKYAMEKECLFLSKLFRFCTCVCSLMMVEWNDRNMLLGS